MKQLAAALLFCAAPLTAQEAAPQVVLIQEHSPVAAGVFSALIPGAGQGYNGQWDKAGLSFGAQVFLIALGVRTSHREDEKCDADIAAWEKTHPPAGVSFECDSAASSVVALALVANWAIGIVDAARTAKHLNAEARARVEASHSADGQPVLQLRVRTR